MNSSTRQSPRLRTHLRRAVTTSVALAGITVAAYATVATMAHDATLDMTTGSSSDDEVVVVPQQDDATADVAHLVARHGCWTSTTDMPANMDGRIPGHVVVTAAASPTTAIYSAELVQTALDQVFTPSADADLTVYAFCR